MSETGGLESYVPGEGGSGVPEQLSEEAKQRFAAAAAAIKQWQREEKQSKKRDQRVAQAIIQFLSSDDRAHLFLLISRLVARNCPSIFILSILSLISEECLKEVQDHLQEVGQKSAHETVEENSSIITASKELDTETNRVLVEWITLMQLVLSLSPEAILSKLMIDEKNIDGTVLQLTTFVLQEFFASRKREAPFEKLQPLTASILQTVFEPFIASAKKHFLEQRAKSSADENDE